MHCKIEDEPTLKKINKLLILESIAKGKELSPIYDKYAKYLTTTFKAKNALRIINEGLCAEFFSVEKNEILF